VISEHRPAYFHQRSIRSQKKNRLTPRRFFLPLHRRAHGGKSPCNQALTGDFRAGDCFIVAQSIPKLFTQTQLRRRATELGKEITRDYRGQPLTIVFLLHGAIFFTADLLRKISLPLEIQALNVSSYQGTSSTGQVVFSPSCLPDLSGREVLLVDDILDTGRTLAEVKRRLLEETGAAGVKICVLLDKQVPRAIPVVPDYVGFTIGDQFVVGYGLDYNGAWRNLPYIGVLQDDPSS
jgi:hypoxanthine phosphoribosyltransferase